MIPSRQEAFGLVALEAALMARPVVATRVGGLPEVVVHEETGLLVEPENPEKLADAAEYLLAHVKTATKMGLAAQARAQEIFGWQRYIDAYDTLYQQLTHESFVRNSKAAISSHGPEP
jgi:glycogen(starch) synthase